MKIFTKLEIFLFILTFYIFYPTYFLYATDEILRTRIFCMFLLMTWQAMDIREEQLQKKQVTEEQMDPLNYQMVGPSDIFFLSIVILLRFIFY